MRTEKEQGNAAKLTFLLLLLQLRQILSGNIFNHVLMYDTGGWYLLGTTF
jgi:hypothetical protein